MGATLTKILQRVLPALKEHQKTLEILQNQNIIQEQEIAILKNQKALIEQHVGELTAELTTAQVIIEELRVNSKRLMLFSGFCALGCWLYIRKLEHDHQEDDNCDDTDSTDDDVSDNHNTMMIPDSLECIVCMENAKEVMMEPCGHVCICRTCAEVMRLPSGRVKCPVCRIRAETRTVFIT